MRLVNLVGSRFGRLMVTGRWALNANNGDPMWETLCDCGNTQLVQGAHLRHGHTKSCGCLREGHPTHGRSFSKEHRAWTNMLTRCRNTNNHAYKDYGGRGISVCESWAKSFSAFLDDVGFAPSKTHSLDRINNDGNYEPGNVRWATKREQARNRRRPHKETANG